MAKYDDWKVYQWHCPNCGKKVTGFKSGERTVKGQCSCCKACMVRVMKTQKHETIEVYACEGM